MKEYLSTNSKDDFNLFTNTLYHFKIDKSRNGNLNLYDYKTGEKVLELQNNEVEGWAKKKLTKWQQV